MKCNGTILVASLSLFICTTCLAETTSQKVIKRLDHTCIVSEHEFKTQAPEIYDSIEESGSIFSTVEDSLDRGIPVLVNLKTKRCSSSQNQSINSSDIPSTAQPGDKRTVTQTRGRVRSTYQQTFIGGQGWVTTAVNQELLPEAPEAPGGT